MNVYQIPSPLPANDSTGSPAQRLARALAFVPLDVAGLKRVPADEAIPTRSLDPMEARRVELASSRRRLLLATMVEDEATAGVTVLPARRRPLALLATVEPPSDAAIDAVVSAAAQAARNDSTPGVTVHRIDLPALGITETPVQIRRSRRPMRVALAAAGITIAGLLAPGGSGPAQAAAAAPPLTVVVDSAVTTVRVPVATSLPHLAATVVYPTSAGIVASLPVIGVGPVGVATVRIPSTLLQLGAQRWTLADADGVRSSFVVTVLRRSRVSAPMATPFPGGVVLAGVVSHYDPRTGGQMGDAASAVQVQALRAGRWTTLATAVTPGVGPLAGDVDTVLTLPTGPVTLRFFRAPGANVTGGTGVPVTVIVPPMASARGDLT